jgi:hypothetical protein
LPRRWAILIIGERLVNSERDALIGSVSSLFAKRGLSPPRLREGAWKRLGPPLDKVLDAVEQHCECYRR